MYTVRRAVQLSTSLFWKTLVLLPYYADKTLLTQVLFLLSLQILFLVSISVSWITSQSGQQFYLSFKVCKNLLALHNVNITRNYVMMIAWQLVKEQLKRLITPFFTWVYSLWLHHLSIYQEKLLFMR